MRRRTVIILLSVVVTAIVAAGAVVWFNAESYEDTVTNCRKAFIAQTKAGQEGKPSACKDVKEDDYMGIVVANAIDGMSKHDRDTLDYFDNGTIDGSIG
jgi:CDP-diacylglycerol pyrophosphatase